MRSRAFNNYDDGVLIVDLRTTDHSGLIATGVAAPRLSWQLRSNRPDVRQIGYEIEVASDAAFDLDRQTSGFVASSSPLHRAWPVAPLRSREVRWWRVRVWTAQGRTAWSTAFRVEAALLHSADWVARPITPNGGLEHQPPAAVHLLRRVFQLDQPFIQARLYITALGVHETCINGRAIAADLLEPGWTAYAKRLLYAAYDVTDLLTPGENIIAATLGEGWWARDVTALGLHFLGPALAYGSRTALLAQLEVRFADGRLTTVATDEHWKSGTGGLRSASLFNGVEVDLRQEPHGWRQASFDDRHWQSVCVGNFPPGLELRSAPPVRVVESFKKAPSVTPSGTLLLDTGQNLAGYLRLRVRGHAGAALTVRHAEVLDTQGKLYTAPLNTAKATDRYVLAGEDAVIVEPSFTYHGFRYAEITANPSVVIEEVTVCVVASDVRSTGSFECSDARVNRLFENVRWSQRGNFLALPTDCPQRDERLGWTGDIQVFASTACVNADARAFLASWLDDLAHEQRGDGCVPSIVPNIAPGWDWEYGGAGWGDAATLVPWTLYQAYGDAEMLLQQYPSMRAWVDWSASRLGPDRTWTGDRQWGDWLDPNSPTDAPQKAATDADYIASSYLSWSAKIVACAAAVLDKDDDSEAYRRLSTEVAAATWQRWRSHAMTTQTGCAIALEYNIAPEEDRPRVARALAQLVEQGGGKIATGFLGTPLLLPALTRSGQIDTAYRVLMNTDCPGWLYQVLHGATTTWERWDAIKPDNSIHSGTMEGLAAGTPSMVSFNHYAFGAVAAWLYQSVAGLSPTASDPGYGTVIFAPVPGGGMTSARARVESSYGLVSIAWALCGSSFEVELELPPGARGWFVPPAGRWHSAPAGESITLEDTGEARPRRGHRLASGHHCIRLLSGTSDDERDTCEESVT